MRKLIAGVLGTVAIFVTLFGLGMTSWSIVALGVALLVLAVALVAVRGGGRAWVNGVAHVHSASEPPTSYAFGRCELQIVIDAPGLPPRSKKIIEPRVPVSKWPDVGQALPIKVALDDQRHVRILWDEVPTHAEAAEALADLPPEFDELDPHDDEILIEQDAPPWAQRLPDDDFPMPPPPPGDPVTADLTDDLGGLRDEPLVMRHTPGGTIVLEGTLVEPAPTTTPLPRRPSSPDYRREPARAVGEPDVVAPTGATDPDLTAGDFTAPEFATPEFAAPEFATPTAATGPDVDVPGPAPDVDPPAPIVVPAAPSAAAEPEPVRPVPDEIDIDLDVAGPRRTGDRAEADEALLAGLTGAAPAGGATPRAGAPEADDEADEALLAGLAGAAPAGGPSGGSPIHGVGITLLVTDLDRSVAFYRDMLGFFEIDGGEGNAVLASGSTRLVIRAIPDVAPINRRLVHLNLEVNDVEAVYEDLKAKGVRFTYAPRAVNRGAKLELWAAAFRDPDGHGIALTQWRDRRTS